MRDVAQALAGGGWRALGSAALPGTPLLDLCNDPLAVLFPQPGAVARRTPGQGKLRRLGRLERRQPGPTHGAVAAFDERRFALGSRFERPVDRRELGQVALRQARQLAAVKPDAAAALAEIQRDWLIKLRKEFGLGAAVRLAGPFIMSSQGKP